MPWRARADVGFSLLALALAAATVTGCVSVTTRAAPQPTTSGAPTLLASPSSAAAGVTDAPVPDREREARPPGPSLSPAPTPPGSVAGVAPAALAAAASPAAASLAEGSPSAAIASASPVLTPAPAADPTPTSGPADPTATAQVAESALPVEPTASHGAAPSATSPASAEGTAGPELGQDVTTASGVLERRAIRRIERILARTTGKKGVAGLQVAVRLADGQTWLGTAGSAAFAPSRPVRDDTVFSIASVSKTFIAALILQLAEEGRLDLDAPYGRYIPEGPRRERVTVRQLLSHTSGIYDYFANPRYQRAATAWLRTRPQPGLLARDHEWTFDEIMDLVKPAAYCKPGRCYHYSNTNYILLGRVAEAVGEAPLHRLLRRRFFRPLGLDDTYYQPAEAPPASAAHGHWPNGAAFIDHTRGDPLRPFTAAASVAGAAGAIASTARDLSVWADALYGGRILSPASLAALTAIQPEGTYGLGTDYAVFAGHRAYGHRGGLRGFEASMWYFPDEGVSISLLSNQGNWFQYPARSIDIPMQGIVTAVLGKRG